MHSQVLFMYSKVMFICGKGLFIYGKGLFIYGIGQFTVNYCSREIQSREGSLRASSDQNPAGPLENQCHVFQPIPAAMPLLDILVRVPTESPPSSRLVRSVFAYIKSWKNPGLVVGAGRAVGGPSNKPV